MLSLRFAQQLVAFAVLQFNVFAERIVTARPTVVVLSTLFPPLMNVLVLQNHLGSYNVSGMYLDVQGFSHKQLSVFTDFHNQYPDVPMMATECCSCMSQRGVDEDSCPQPEDGGCSNPPAALPNGTFYNNNIGNCTAEQVGR